MSSRHEVSALALLALAMAAGLGGACKRDGATSKTSGSTLDAGASPSAGPASPGVAPSADSARPGAAPAGAASAFAGKYTTTHGSIYVPAGKDVPNPQEWDGVKFRGDDGGTELGEGTMRLMIDATSRRVSGEMDGILGPMLVEGRLEEDRFRGTLTRKKADDGGLVGTATGTLKSDAAAGAKGRVLEGAFDLSNARANIVRRGTFSLAPVVE